MSTGLGDDRPLFFKGLTNVKRSQLVVAIHRFRRQGVPTHDQERRQYFPATA